MLSREFDRLVVARAGPRSSTEAPDEVLEIDGARSGGGSFRTAGRRWAARWSLDPIPHGESFAIPRLRFPLRFRGRRPGDRIRLVYGSKKVKKLLGEARVPVSERERLPVLVDAAEQVLWIPGVARGTGADPGSGEAALHIAIGDEGRV